MCEFAIHKKFANPTNQLYKFHISSYTKANNRYAKLNSLIMPFATIYNIKYVISKYIPCFHCVCIYFFSILLLFIFPDTKHNFFLLFF